MLRKLTASEPSPIRPLLHHNSRLRTLSSAQESEAIDAMRASKRGKRQSYLRNLLGTHTRQVKDAKSRLAALVAAARAEGRDPKGDPEVIRMKELVTSLANKDVYGSLMRGESKGAEVNIEALAQDDASVVDVVLQRFRDFVASSQLRIVDFFRRFDRDGSGSVDAREFRDALKSMGIEASEGTAVALIHKVDPNGDGLLNYRELVSIVKLSHAAEIVENDMTSAPEDVASTDPKPTSDDQDDDSYSDEFP